MVKRRILKISNLEKVVYFSAILSFVLTITMQIFMGASFGKTTMSVEKIKYEIATQEKQNESLNMKINELTAYDNVKDVVKNMGLAYNNDNIIVVNK